MKLKHRLFPDVPDAALLQTAIQHIQWTWMLMQRYGLPYRVAIALRFGFDRGFRVRTHEEVLSILNFRHLSKRWAHVTWFSVYGLRYLPYQEISEGEFVKMWDVLGERLGLSHMEWDSFFEQLVDREVFTSIQQRVMVPETRWYRMTPSPERHVQQLERIVSYLEHRPLPESISFYVTWSMTEYPFHTDTRYARLAERVIRSSPETQPAYYYVAKRQWDYFYYLEDCHDFDPRWRKSLRPLIRKSERLQEWFLRMEEMLEPECW